MLLGGFPHVLENLDNNKFIFQVLEISLNLTKSGNVLQKYPENNIAWENIRLEWKACE